MGKSIQVEKKRKSHPSGNPWSNEEVEQLIELWTRDVPIHAIANHIGRSHRSVAVKAVRIGLKNRVSDEGQRQLIRNPDAKLRNCLCCSKLFFSAGIGNRVCKYCKSGTLWESGSDYVLNEDIYSIL